MPGFYSRDIVPAVEDAADAVADRVAAVLRCRQGCLDGPGGVPVPLVRFRRSYRVNGTYAGGAQMAARKYICPACGELVVACVELRAARKTRGTDRPGNPAVGAG